jgi:hypothetical protein
MNEEREKSRVKFAKHRNKGHSIVTSCKRAGISPSTYYALNKRKRDAWSTKGGWDKNGW